jgi:hypothetical protein
MQFRRRHTLIALPLAAAIALGACGSDKKDVAPTAAPTTAAATTVAPAGTEPPAATEAPAGGSLKGLCPDQVTIQADWMPEAEHGFIYQMVGEGYTIDKAKAAVVGPLIDENGADTGVKIRIQSGGAAQNFQSDTSILYQDDSVLLAFVYTDEAIQNSATFPTISIEAGFNKNPQMIMWDPATYPDVKGIADLGKEKVKVRYFGGAAYMDYFTSTGILSKDQVDGSYTGDPSLFVTDEGKSAQQGFGSAEPFLYEHELKDWAKPVKYEYINDAGWQNYAESIATKPDNVTKYADCFKKLVPIIQHATVDYVNDPARTNAIILDAAGTFGGDFGWTYTQGAADYGVATMKKDGLVSNGADGVMGKFDTKRVDDLITIAVPVYTAQDSPPKKGLKAEDFVTNQFIDDSIKL